jgi:hypothetical protein
VNFAIDKRHRDRAVRLHDQEALRDQPLQGFAHRRGRNAVALRHRPDDGVCRAKAANRPRFSARSYRSFNVACRSFSSGPRSRLIGESRRRGHRRPPPPFQRSSWYMMYHNSIARRRLAAKMSAISVRAKEPLPAGVSGAGAT